MLIRSQNKMSLVKFENIVVNINNINGKEIICWSQMNPGEDEYISLGHYSAKAKTMKVLDMIQEAYEEYKITCTFLTGFTGHRAIVESNDIRVNGYEELIKSFKKNMVFQMPEDSEVEARAMK